MSHNIEKFPMLEILPHPDNNSFDVVLRKDWNVDAEYVGRVTNVKWSIPGPKPDWLIEHKQYHAPEKERGFVPPPGFSKNQLIDNAAFYFFLDKEFTSQELFDTIKEHYPTYPISVEGIGVHLGKNSKKFIKRIVAGRIRIWKCIAEGNDADGDKKARTDAGG